MKLKTTHPFGVIIPLGNPLSRGETSAPSEHAKEKSPLERGRCEASGVCF